MEGFINVQSPLAPNNDNPRGYVTGVEYVKGAPQNFSAIDKLVAFHPNRMENGMTASVRNYPTAGVTSKFVLVGEPSQMLNASNESIVTLENFTNYWTLETQVESTITTVRQYAADGPAGSSPTYPYTPGTESEWSNEYDNSKGHRWLRQRNDDIDDNADGIFDNWSVPINIGTQYQGGDYIDKRFRREAVSPTVHVAVGTLTNNKYYLVQKGFMQITGDLTLNDINSTDTSGVATLEQGRTFKYVSSNAYTFNDSAELTETLRNPPRYDSGLPNNEPTGWDETVPAGTDQLWEISGQKSVYGQLKTDWILKRIVENPNYLRYSNAPSPLPDTIAGINTPANTGSPEDIALEAAGWAKVYAGQNFIAKREDDPGAPLYTPWEVSKINEESGEYTDRVFKLFSINLDSDSPFVSAPTNADATKDGWSDTPLEEDDENINFVSEARKFFNGELKTPWSNPVPFTGRDSFIDFILAAPASGFKKDQFEAVSPATITLTAGLVKGISDIWENPGLTITYEWRRVFNNGAADSTIAPHNDTGQDFYTLIETNVTPGPGEFRNKQRLVVKPAAVTGEAVFRVTQTITFAEGDPIVFEDEISIPDITDGKDAKSFIVISDNESTIYDNVGLVFVPVNVVLRAYNANLVGLDLRWWLWDGSAWNQLTNGVGGYTIGGNSLSVAAATIFAADNTGQEKRYAATSGNFNPTSANYDTTFADFITVYKLSAAGVGVAGENALSVFMSNEAHTVVLDNISGEPQAGEYAKAKTRVKLFDGLTPVVNSGWSIVLNPLDATVDYSQTDIGGAGGTEKEIAVTDWDSPTRSHYVDLAITYGAINLTRRFSLASTMDAPGSLLLSLDSDKGLIFDINNRGTKIITASLYQDNVLLVAGYEYRFLLNGGVIQNWSTTRTINITRSQILANLGQLVCEVRPTAGAVVRTSTIKFTDVLDSQSYRAYTTNTVKPAGAQLLTNQAGDNKQIDGSTAAPEVFATGTPYPNGSQVLSGVTWYLAKSTFWNNPINIPVWFQEAVMNANGTWTWGPVLQLKGEIGSQGEAGGFYLEMYAKNSNSGVAPALGSGGGTALLGAMESAGWSYILPSAGAGEFIWVTKRQWRGSFGGVTVSFKSNGKPFYSNSVEPTDGDNGALSTWGSPIRLTPTAPEPTINGTNGTNGLSPGLAVFTRGDLRKILQLNAWLNDVGTSVIGPTGSRYLGPSGFTTDPAAGVPIDGEPIQMQYANGYIQWKYVSEGSGSWRNLVAIKSDSSYQVIKNTLPFGFTDSSGTYFTYVTTSSSVIDDAIFLSGADGTASLRSSTTAAIAATHQIPLTTWKTRGYSLPDVPGRAITVNSLEEIEVSVGVSTASTTAQTVRVSLQTYSIVAGAWVERVACVKRIIGSFNPDIITVKTVIPSLGVATSLRLQVYVVSSTTDSVRVSPKTQYLIKNIPGVI